MRVSEFITSFRLSLRYCSTYETITSYRTILGFSLLRPELQGIMFIYIGIHVSERTFAKSEDRRGGREGRSLDNALDDVPINRAEQKRDERRGTRYRGACIPLCSLRSDARPVRHQTSYIDHIIGRRSFRYTR